MMEGESVDGSNKAIDDDDAGELRAISKP